MLRIYYILYNRSHTQMYIHMFIVHVSVHNSLLPVQYLGGPGNYGNDT